MKKRKILGLCLLALGIVGISACDKNDDPTNEPNDNNPTDVVTQYEVTFETNGGSAIEKLTVNENGTVTLPTNPVKDGYYFAGWYSDSACEVEFDVNTKITSNITLYAKFLQKSKVSFDTNGNGEIASVDTNIMGRIVKPNDPSKEGYAFGGWFTDKELTTEFDFDSVVKEDMTLYAKFVEVQTLSFDTDGGEAIADINYTELTNVSLPIPMKTGVVFSHWVDSNNTEYNYLPAGTKGITNLKAVYREAGEIDNEFTSLANNLDSGALTAKVDGIFTITGEVRGRIKTWTNPEDETQTKTWDKSYKIGSSSASISFTAPGDGMLSFYIQNGSSGAATQKVTVACSDGFNNEIEFSGKTTAVAPYPAGSPVVKIDVPVSKGLTYTIKRVSGTIDIFELNLSCKVLEDVVTGVKLNDAGKTEYIEGEKLNISNLNVSAIHGNNMYISQVHKDAITVDTSSVDMSKAGTYDVVVNYGQFSTTYPIVVHEIEKIDLGFNATYNDRSSYNGIYVNGKVQTIYELNEEFNPDYLTVRAITKSENSAEFIVKSNVSYSGFSSKEAGQRNVKVTFYANGKEFTATYPVYVVDTTPYKDANNNYVVTVNHSYNGVIGAQHGENGNMFTTIGQALEFLSGTSIDQSVNKVLNVKAGYYKEKLEINIPYLTIVGEGSTKATYSGDSQYDRPSYTKATIIEWDSLYGIEDESGYSQITDSTATVAIREAATNVTIKNVTLSNYWNCEEVFQDEMSYLESVGIAVSGKANDHRALALIVQADKFTMDNCALLGYQDTVELMTGRQLITNTYISGNTDFIFGTNAAAYFYNCEIFVNYKVGGSGYITAVKGCNSGASDAVTYGFIFDNCKFTADERVGAGTFALGRPWGAYSNVTIMNSELGNHIGTSASSRYVPMGGVNPTDATVSYKEYNNTGDSALDTAVEGMTLLDATTASNYSDLTKVFAASNGAFTFTDDWAVTLTK